MRLRPGDTFDRYVIETLLGEGGMGEVYQARDSRLERRVALKVLRRDAAENPEAWSRALVRMLREARAAAALNHPNTVAIFDIGDVAGQPYLAMELIEGESLRKLIDANVSVQTKLGWLLDVARALSAAHRAGLVHRDVKPENVMLRSDGMIKVLDFGIARRVQFDGDEVASTQRGAAMSMPDKALERTSVLPGSSDTVTGEGVMVGTPAYMAPEQLRGEPVDARTDQFGWGVLAYEFLSGKVPFGAGQEGVRLLSAILSDEPPSLDGIVPAAIERVLRRTIAKRKSERFPSMEYVLDALTPHIAGDGANGGDDMLLGASDSAVSTMGDTSDEPPPRRRTTRPPPEPQLKSPSVAPESASVSSPLLSQSASPSVSPQMRVTPTFTQRSPDLDKSGRITPAPPTPIVRVEKAGKTNAATTTLESPVIVAASKPFAARKRWVLPVMGVGVIWLVAGAIWAYSFFRKEKPVVALDPPTPPPVATAITELPIPPSTSADAIVAYKEGLQALRDASWDRARVSFERATTLDHSFGSAYLRIAIIDRFRKDTASARQAFQRATELQASLSPRDRVLLNAFEPSMQRDPPDFLETSVRIDEAARERVGDAELVHLQILLKAKGDPQQTIALADRCLALDSKYADCWQVKAFLLTRLNREQEALGALNQCIAVAPSAMDCLIQRLGMHKYMGRCDQLQSDVRRWVAKEQKEPLAYRELAVALFSVGQSSAAVGAAVEQAGRRLKEAGRHEESERFRMQWALLTGDFDGALRIALGLAQSAEADPLEEKHMGPALSLVEIYRETGQDRKAAEVASRFLAERAAWTKPIHLSPWYDFSVILLDAERANGTLAEDAFEKSRTEWTKVWPNEELDRAAIWLNGYAATARSEMDARRALAMMPPLRNAAYYSANVATTVESLVGGVYFLAGEYGNAEPYLERAAHGCTALDEPLRHTVATYRLGVVREARGDHAGACAAYATVLSRWANEKRSVTAKNALSRSKHMKCSD